MRTSNWVHAIWTRDVCWFCFWCHFANPVHHSRSQPVLRHVSRRKFVKVCDMQNHVSTYVSKMCHVMVRRSENAPVHILQYILKCVSENCRKNPRKIINKYTNILHMSDSMSITLNIPKANIVVFGSIATSTQFSGFQGVSTSRLFFLETTREKRSN